MPKKLGTTSGGGQRRASRGLTALKKMIGNPAPKRHKIPSGKN
jgi:hypothetical protein